jgi:gamma-glutamylcyclotransferase (GGCT)/AIG2-like uncharacterized protein YtfP
MSGTSELVFVYGTLRRGASNHWRMEEAEFVTEAWVLGHLYLIDWYPGMVLDDDGVPVRGEVYRVDTALLAKLDEFEGVGGEDEYARVKTEVRQDTGPGMEAWVWEYRRDVRERKEIGPADWVNPGPRETLPMFVMLSILFTVGGVVALRMWQQTWLWDDAPVWLRVAVIPVVHIAMIGLCANAAQWRNERWRSVAWIAFGVAWIVDLGMGFCEL